MPKKVYPTFQGTVENGKLTLGNPKRFAEFLHTLKGNVQLIVKPMRRRRTLDQNAYYWGVIIEMTRAHWGYETKEAMHNALARHFLTKHDKKFPYVPSTSDLSTTEFSEYIEQCRQLAAEDGIVIPDPFSVAI